MSRPDVSFTCASLPEIGATRRQLTDALSEGRLRRVLRNVFVHHDVPDTVEVRAAAAALVVAPEAVFVDRTAAWLHGFDVLDYREKEVLPPLECVVHGLRVTSVLRTALDLGCVLPRPDGLAALDMFLRAGLAKSDLERSLPRYRRRRGVVRLHDDGLPAPVLQCWVEEHGTLLFRLDHGYPRHRLDGGGRAER